MDVVQLKVFTLAPYRILPANTGGQLSIACMHDAIGRLCETHVISTANNAQQHNYAFTLHPLLSEKPIHYAPFYKLNKLTKLARRVSATHIICEHPYMAPTAIMLSRTLRIPWYLRSQNIESLRFKTLGKPWWPVLYHYERMAMQQATGVFFITPEDEAWARQFYRVKPSRSHIIPYGTSLRNAPAPDVEAKQSIAGAFGLDVDAHWFYFLGVHSYIPNADAVRYILTEVVPRLSTSGMHFQVLIGGKGLSEALQQMIGQTNGAVRYFGFVDDLDTFIRACDTMLNPVVTGGGIKTKAIEALAYNKTVVSTRTGAAGILREVCGDKLMLAGDGDWDEFARCCISAADRKGIIPPLFYSRYNWNAIGKKVAGIMTVQD
jgi:glycosyltransferase involved in cell wall biosynthesis